MTNRDIHLSLAQASGTSIADARRVTNIVFASVKEVLRTGGTVTIHGFGNIRLSEITAPETFASAKRKAVTAVRFRPSRILKNSFNVKRSIKKVACSNGKIVSRKLKQVPKKVKPLFKGRKYQR